MRHPIPDSALDDRLGFVGTAGSGKTYNAGGAVERLLDRGARVVMVDPLDVWWGLRLIADGSAPSRYTLPIFGGAHGDLPLNEHAGALIGETVATMAESCIVSLGGLQTKSAERRFMLALLDALYRKANGEPVHIVFDEADLWAPQKSSEPMLQSRMEEICRRGRIKGLIPWLITQRPAVISKDVLSQVDGLVAFKLTSSQDRDALEGWIEGQADRAQWKEIRAALPTLQQGQGVVWIPGRSVLETISFPQKRTFDSSRTPKRGEKKRTAALKPLDLGALKDRLASIEIEVKSNDPKALKAEVARLQRELTSKSTTTAPQADLAAVAHDGYVKGQAAARAEYAPALSAFHKLIEEGTRRADKLRDAAQALVEIYKPKSGSPAQMVVSAASPITSALVPLMRRSALPSLEASGDGPLTNPQRNLLHALAWWRQMGHDEPTRAQVAAIAGWKPNGSNLKDRLSELSKLALVEYPRQGVVRLTAMGIASAPEPDMSVTLVDSVRSILSGPQLRLFDALRSFNGEVGRLMLAERIGWTADGSNLKDRLSELSRLELVEYPHRGSVALQDWVTCR